MFKYFKKQNNLDKFVFCLHQSAPRGFAILFSILLASFLITLGISIFSISLKEIMITTSVRDSQIAYYIADSARECVLYWDIKQGAFPACLSSDCSIRNSTTLPIICNGSTAITLPFNPAGLTYSTSIISNFFRASSTLLSSPVSDISINKTFNPVTSRVVTTITAYGHNTGIIGRRVERGVQTVNN